MKDDFKRLGISGEDDELRNTSVQGLGGFVGSFLDLLESGSGLEDLEDFLLEFLVGKRDGSRLGGVGSVILILKKN